MTQQNVSFSDNINAFNGFMTTMTNVMNKTKNIGYSSNKNLTTIAGITNCEALGVLGQPVALKSELSSKADVNHNHNSSYSAINHTHKLDDVIMTYEEETMNEEEELVIETKKKTLSDLLDEKASVNHNHDSSYASSSHTHSLSDITDYTAPDLSGYATTSAMNTALSGKANTQHTHESILVLLSDFTEQVSRKSLEAPL